MIPNIDYKSICSVSEMAARVGLSRARFYQLQEAGVFPEPLYCDGTGHPYYSLELQEKCIEIRKTGIGYNGRPTLFYVKRGNSSAYAKVGKKDKYSEISNALDQMGLKIKATQIKKAVKLLHPNNWHQLDINGELIAELFRYFRKGV